MVEFLWGLDSLEIRWKKGKSQAQRKNFLEAGGGKIEHQKNMLKEELER